LSSITFFSFAASIFLYFSIDLGVVGKAFLSGLALPYDLPLFLGEGVLSPPCGKFFNLRFYPAI
jgi:hypothetical protein